MDPITIVLGALVALSAIPSVPTRAPDRVTLTVGVAAESFQWGQLAGPEVGMSAPLKRGAKARVEALVNVMDPTRDYAYATCHVTGGYACAGHDDYLAVEGLLRVEPTRTWTGVMRPYFGVGYQVGTVRTSETNYLTLAKARIGQHSVARPVWRLGIHWADHMAGLPLALDIGFIPRASWTRDYLRMNSAIGVWY